MFLNTLANGRGIHFPILLLGKGEQGLHAVILVSFFLQGLKDVIVFLLICGEFCEFLLDNCFIGLQSAEFRSNLVNLRLNRGIGVDVVFPQNLFPAFNVGI